VAPAEGRESPKTRFGGAYWAFMVISLILILAGGVVGFFGPRLFPPHAARAPAPAAGLATRPGASK
jgi:hypothetical protein